MVAGPSLGCVHRIAVGPGLRPAFHLLLAVHTLEIGLLEDNFKIVSLGFVSVKLDDSTVSSYISGAARHRRISAQIFVPMSRPGHLRRAIRL